MTPSQKTLQNYQSQVRSVSKNDQHLLDRFDQEKSSGGKNPKEKSSSFSEVLKERLKNQKSH